MAAIVFIGRLGTTQTMLSATLWTWLSSYAVDPRRVAGNAEIYRCQAFIAFLLLEKNKSLFQE